MQILRSSEGSTTVVDETGRELMELVPLAAVGVELEDVLERVAVALAAPALPRVVVVSREGLTESVAADIPCELVLVDEDRFDDPPVSLHRRAVAGDPAATSVLLRPWQGRGDEA